MDLTLILTEDCNLRCRYCYQKHFRRNSMGPETGIKAVAAALEHDANHLALTFFGGEPLLESETLFEILKSARRMASDRGTTMTAKVPTNGLLLHEEIVDQAKRHGLFVSLSFDGVRPAQDSGRVGPNGESSFDDVQRALKLLVRSRLPFAVYSVITPLNVAYLAESRRYLWEMGARIIVVAIDYTSPWTAEALEALEEQYHRVAALYERWLREKAYFQLEPFDSRISQRTRSGDWSRCCPGVGQITVAPDGTLFGCTEYFYRRLQPLGNLETWLDPARVREMSKERCARPEECYDCGLQDRCNNMCACVNLRTTGHANIPPDSLCVTEQLALQAADRIASRLFRKRVPEFLLRKYSSSYHMLTAIEKLFESMGVDHEPVATR